MRHSILKAILPIAASLWLIGTALPLHAGEIAGIKFVDTAEVSGQALVLNGLGTRYRAVFKVYVAGLYLPKKSQDDKEVLAMLGAKRIHAVMLRDVEGEVLGKLLIQGIRDNTTQSEALKHLPSISKLGQAFSERKKIAAGESFTVDFNPQIGPQVSMNGKALNSQGNDSAFNNVFLRVWLGENPADHILKKGLLNQPIENRVQH